MNLPNKLTILRVLMIPVFLVFLMTDVAGENGKWIAVAIFIIASLTDFLDGYIARKYNLVSNFGKFMDPLADKLLVLSALICMIEYTSCLLCNDRTGWYGSFIFIGGNYHYCKRIYHQWFSSGGI